MNKIDYNKLMNDEIMNLKGVKPKLLLHACCAPCSSAVLERLAKHFQITIFYYNPNIFPESEYECRREEIERYLKKLNIDVVFITYNHAEFLSEIKNLEEEKEKGNRCKKCYDFRMEKSAQFAKENGYDYFTTTLSISPHKVLSFIIESGERLEKKYGIKFLRSDFKKENGFLRSSEISEEENFYRQAYCGCEFSIRK